MGLIQEVIESSRETVDGRAFLEIRAGSDHGVSAPLFNPPGFDSQPLRDDLILLHQTTDQGGGAYAGSVDLANPGKAEPGEGRIYARKSDGTVIAEIWAKADGVIQILPGPGVRCQVGSGTRKAAARDGDTVTIGTPNIPPALAFWAWVAAVNTILVPLSGGTLPPVPPTEITGATVAASAQKLETE